MKKAGFIADEMIQTAQIGSLPTDETHKYESEPIYESFAENIEPSQFAQPLDTEDLTAELENEDWAKTPPSSSKANLEESVNDLNREKDTALPLNFDDFDLLEFPQTLHKDASSETVSSAGSEFSDEAAQLERDAASEVSEPPFQTSAASLPENFSPELIEAIADRVAEKLSNDVIKRVVSEVLSQMEGKR